MEQSLSLLSLSPTDPLVAKSGQRTAAFASRGGFSRLGREEIEIVIESTRVAVRFRCGWDQPRPDCVTFKPASRH